MIKSDTIVAGGRELRKFGMLFAAIFAVLATYFFFRESDAWLWFAGAAVLFSLTGTLAPRILRPIYTGWMKFAFVLGWVNTRLLLGVFFYLIITPIGVVMKLFGKDLLDQKLDRSAKTYWRKRGPFDPKQMEHQF